MISRTDVLLTGAGGQLGRELARQAAGRGLSLRALERAELDITDGEQVARAVTALAPRAVINAAAYTAVDRAESEPEAAFAVNGDGPANLARACARAGVPLIHVSTDYVFDGSKDRPYTENDPVTPLGVYGASKQAGEAAVRAERAPHVILRTAWVYGAEGANFVRTMLRLAAERGVVRVVDDQVGCPTAAADLAGVALVLVRRMIGGQMPADGWGTFHCAGEGPVSWCGFAREIFAQAAARGLKVPEVKPIGTADYPTPARRPANSVLDCGRLARVHGLTLRPWREGLAETLHRLLAAGAAASAG